MRSPERDPDATIRSVARSLELLRCMNQHPEAGLQELHVRTGLPKPTVHRLLATLKAEGYVQQDAGSGGRYRLAAKVRELSGGFTEKSRLVEAGAPIALATTRRIQWPLALGTLDGEVMVVRYSTMPYSPLAVQATSVGHRHGLLESAMGLAYLAFCGQSQRRILIDLLRESAPLDGRGRRIWRASDAAALIAATQRQGYGLRLPKARGDSATVAVPVLPGEGIAGVLSMTTFGNLMTAETLARFIPVLKDTAQDIGAACGAGAP